MPEPYYITIDGEPIEPLGLFAVRPGVDSIGLDRQGEWPYYGAVTARKMYRIPVARSANAHISPSGARLFNLSRRPLP